ncbi:DNA polymerase III subunit alpha [Rubinisphaera margarita]|uniref:DNA polymerase III subunit alpha n=1 Tax=Rubinisphaera margarita TaxID=2909586 RepID=UPI001EE915FF|nr:DNA polymerase III subunit alpha [Rubinisphaera margarita]MCG6158568.1 DNA polymerase III subunit alpha [Rubinisphaera margarita]
MITEATSPQRPFAHLHCHSHYSLLDGANRIPAMIEKVKANNMNALAITDHGNLFGALEFYQKCKAADVNPIIGYEAYIAPGKRTDRSASRMKEASFHLTLLAQNKTGFQNLIKMASSAYLEGFYYKPRIDKDLLEAHSEGIICLSGCASSELSHYLLSENHKEAEQLLRWYEKTFGDRLYLEIQDSGVQIQKDCMERTIELADRFGFPLVATNDAHYLNQEDAGSHEVLLCVNTRTTMQNEKRMKLDSCEFHLRTPEEMYNAFPHCPDAVGRSQEIADRCDIDLDLTARHYPVFQPPEGKTDVTFLRELCEKGLQWRYGDQPAQVYYDRLEIELGVIEKMGYSSYFLIVWDFARFAREKGIPCTARGSACGALVAYLLGLGDVCPIQYDLLFERFLDPSRSEAPDIDIDFCRDRRQWVIDYVKEKYGEESVAQIGTFGTLKAKAALRDVGRALDVPLHRVNEIAKMVPEQLGIKLKDAIESTAELREQYDSDPQIKEMLDFAMALEGLARNVGTHAAGVVIGDRPLDEYIPLQRITGKTDIITQWTDVETAGLLKMDFLGLRNLSILDKAVQNVRENYPDFNMRPIDFPLDDQKTFALLQRGETKGIFQLESGGMRDLLTKMKPDKFADIIATSALYRPGPLEGGMVMTYVEVKHGRQPVPKVHPLVDEVLAETYGVMVYQEQVMRILNRVGGIELSAAYRCIKAISKKKLEIIAVNKEKFIEGAQEKEMSKDKAEELWGLIEKFAGYGFNKSHSTAYGAIAYQTAYLKAHFPKEFMAALLSCGMESSERMAEHTDDCRRMKIDIVPPDLNMSDVEFKVVGDKVAFGLGAIKGVGEGAVSEIVAEREANGKFTNIFDLCERVDPKALTKSVLEILIKAGALDSFGPNREQHMLAMETAVQMAARKHRDKARGQKSLFGGAASAEVAESVAGVVPDAPDWTHAQKLAYEKEIFGFYLTSHPLTEFADEITPLVSHTTKELGEIEDSMEVLVGGMISSIKKATTRNPSRNGNSKYVNFDLEDANGVVRCIMWPDDYSRYQEMVVADEICIIAGRVDRRGREPNLIVNKLMTIESAQKQMTQHLALKFQHGFHTENDMKQVRRILDHHPGNTNVVIVVEAPDESNPDFLTRTTLGSPTLSVTVSTRLREELNQVLGESFYRVHVSAPKKKRDG